MILQRLPAFLSILAFSMWCNSATAQEPTFSLSGVAFTPSIYLSDDELQGAVAPYMNRPITFTDVQAMLADVRRLYTAAGIVTADVLLQPQDVANGILQLDLVEASIGQVDVVDVPMTDASFLSDRISLRAGERPNYEAIQRDMRIFELAYDVRPRLTFSPGSEFAVSDVSITADEPDQRTWILSVDNFAAESLGRWQATIAGQWRSVSGQRDTLSYSLGLGEGIQELSLSYARPVGLTGAKVTGSLGYSSTQVVRGDFAVLDVVTDDIDVAVGYQALAYVEDDRYWRFGGDLRYSETTSKLLDATLQDRSMWEAEVNANYNRTFAMGTLNARVGLVVGGSDTGGLASTDGDFQLLTANLQYGRTLGPNWVGEVAFRGQYTDQGTLPAAKLFSLGGLSSVRGYPDGVLSGLSGLDMRVQVSRAPMPLSQATTDLSWSPFMFMDAGTIDPVIADENPINVYSAGFGLRATFREDTRLLATIATPLADVEGQDIPEGPEIYFGLDYQF